VTKHPNLELLERFYAAFDRRDGAEMARCYAPGCRFSDPVFVDLHDEEPGAMWRMLTARSRDLSVQLVACSADDVVGSARWIARYTFAQTGRPVTNRVDSTFRFENGLIIEQRDAFGFHRWASQALGKSGLLFGWTPVVRSAVRRKARAGLASHQADQ
jgi:ketosteroid isomerase-like protein